MFALPDAQLLTFVTFAPLATVLLLLALHGVALGVGLPRLPAVLWHALGLVGSVAVFGASLSLFTDFDLTEPSFQFVGHAQWLPRWGVDYLVGIDGISLFLVLLTTFITPVLLVASWNEIEHQREAWVAAILCLETAVLGAFVSLNLIQFFVFCEVMLIPLTFLIGTWGGERRVGAAVKFFMFSAVASLPLLAAIFALAVLPVTETGTLLFNLVTPPGETGPGLLDWPVAMDDPLWWRNQDWLFGAFALAFALKFSLAPLHSAAPDALVEAPTGASVLIAALVLKLGAYGFLRFALPLFPDAAIAAAPLFVGGTVVAIAYFFSIAMVQPDLKRLVAYAVLAQLGFVMLGIFALNTSALNGAVVQMLSHGLASAGLFLLVGMLERRRTTRLISEFGGVAKPMPVFAACFGAVMLSSIGLPGLGGFVGEILVLFGVYLAQPMAAMLATGGVVLAAICLLGMYRRVMFGPIENPENRGLIDLGTREKLLMVSLLLPIVGIGVYPEPCLRRIEPSVVELLRLVDARSEVLSEEVEPVEAPSSERRDPRDEGEAL